MTKAEGIETLLQDDFLAALPKMVASINDQRHRLAWITDQEAEMLKKVGGTGKPGPFGIQSFPFDDEDQGFGGYDEGEEPGDSENQTTQRGRDAVDDIEAEGDFDPTTDLAGNVSGTAGGVSGTAGGVSGTVGDPTGSFSGPNENANRQAEERSKAFSDYVNDLISRDQAQSRMGITDREFDDLIDRSTVADAQARANALGLSNVSVSMNPDGTLSYNSPDASALGFGLSQMGRAGAQAIGTGFEMGRGISSMTPGGFITDLVTGREGSIGGDLARSLGTPTTGTISENLGINLGLDPDDVERGIAGFFR
jgi:hypothetical protein